MAGDWIKIEHTLPDKPEVFELADTLGIEPEAVVGKLVRLWIWFDQQTYDGTAKVSSVVVDSITRHPGFATALTKVGWLSANGIPNFDRHNGTSAKTRAGVQKRVAKCR